MFKVLLVEDDNNLREIYEARLQAEGYDITSAQDGEQALVVAKEVKPDLIISDVMMPKISGFEMLDILRNTEGMKETKVIMLTALGQAEDRDRADSLGADRYLVKSQVTLEDIVKAAHDLLEPASEPVATANPVAVPATPAVAAADPTPQISLAVPPAAAALSPEPPQVQPVEPAPVIPVTPVASPEPVTPSPITATVAVPSSPVASTPVTSPTPLPEPVVETAITPSTPVASPPVVVAEPVSTPDFNVPDLSVPTSTPPVVTPAPQETPVTTAQPANTPAAPQIDMPTGDTTAQEQITVKNQIEDFIKNAPADSSVVTPTTAAQTEEDASVAATASNDRIMQESVDSLIASTDITKPAEATTAEVTSPVTTSPSEPEKSAAMPPVERKQVAPPQDDENDAVTIAHKKVLQPITDPDTKPDLNELMAREDAKNIINGSAPLGGAIFVSDTPLDTKPAESTTSYPTATTTTNGASGVTPAPKNDIDPNSIAL